MVSYFKGGKKAKYILEQDYEENTWAQRDEDDWRRLHDEELDSLYRSPDIVRVIKSRRIRWAGNVTRIF